MVSLEFRGSTSFGHTDKSLFTGSTMNVENQPESASFFDLARSAVEDLKSGDHSASETYSNSLESLLAEIRHNLGCIGTETNNQQARWNTSKPSKTLCLKKGSINRTKPSHGEQLP